jgi:hypothetical protein
MWMCHRRRDEVGRECVGVVQRDAGAAVGAGHGRYTACLVAAALPIPSAGGGQDEPLNVRVNYVCIGSATRATRSRSAWRIRPATASMP